MTSTVAYKRLRVATWRNSRYWFARLILERPAREADAFSLSVDPVRLRVHRNATARASQRIRYTALRAQGLTRAQIFVTVRKAPTVHEALLRHRAAQRRYEQRWGGSLHAGRPAWQRRTLAHALDDSHKVR